MGIVVHSLFWVFPCRAPEAGRIATLPPCPWVRVCLVSLGLRSFSEPAVLVHGQSPRSCAQWGAAIHHNQV